MHYASEDRKQKRAKPNSEKDYKEEDLIKQLPEGIPTAILSKLPIDEAARTSILSSTWRYLWTLFSGTLDFDGSPTMKTIKKDLKAVSGWHLQVAMNVMFDFERRTYIRWMNELLNSLKSPAMDGLRIWFDVGFEFDVNKWVQFAMQKEVEKLELFLGSAYDYVLPLHLFSLSNINSLRVLRLKHVNLTGDILENLLSCSPFLETLSLVNSRVPKSVKISGSSLNLKHLELVRCREMINLQIFAENLVSFRYYGSFSDTQFKSVPRLVEAAFGGSYVEFIRERFISQIEELKLDIIQNASTLILWLGQFPQLNNLKHLELVACADDITLEACILLLKSSPSLLKFKLKMLNAKPNVRIKRKFTQEYQCSLKELEMVGFSGAAFEVELVKHVFELAAELQKITIDPRLPTNKPKLPPQERPRTWDVEQNRKLAWELQDKIRSPVEFVIL